MRVLCQQAGGIIGVRMQSWGRVLNACGHKFTLWNPSEKPAFDIFDECKPDFFLYSQQDKTRALEKCLAANPHIITAYIPNPEPAIDTFLWEKGEYQDHLACDLAIVTDYTEESARWVIPLCDPKYGLNVKIYGTNPFPLPQSLGVLDGKGISNALRSAVYCPVPPSARDYLFTVIACGGLITPEEWGTDPVKIRDGVNEMRSKGREEREQLADSLRKYGMERYTYWHRVSDFFRVMDMTKEADHILETFRATFIV